MKVKVTRKRVGVEATILNMLEAYLLVNEEFISVEEVNALKLVIEYQRKRTPTDQCPLSVSIYPSI